MDLGFAAVVQEILSLPAGYAYHHRDGTKILVICCGDRSADTALQEDNEADGGTMRHGSAEASEGTAPSISYLGVFAFGDLYPVRPSWDGTDI